MQTIKIKLILLLINIIRPLRRLLKSIDYKLIDLV
jgi:hypothetical protein